MVVQARNDVTIAKLVLSGEPKVKDSAIFKQDAGATVPIAARTVVVQDPATLLWEPLTDVTDITGLGAARGIVIDAIAAADLVAGNVVDQPVIIGGPITVDKDLLVFENSVVLTDEVTVLNITVEDSLISIGIFPEATAYVSQHENA